MPPYFLVVEECTNVNFSKSVGKASFGIPDENNHVNAKLVCACDIRKILGIMRYELQQEEEPYNPTVR